MDLVRLVAKRAVQLAAVLLDRQLLHLPPGPAPAGRPDRRDHPVRDRLAEGAAARGPRARPGVLRAVLELPQGAAVRVISGHQYSTGRPVTELVNQSLPVSLQLMIYAQFIALLFAIPLGDLRGVSQREPHRPEHQHVRLRAAGVAELRARAALVVLHRRRAQVVTDLRLRAGLLDQFFDPSAHRTWPSTSST